MLIQRLLVLRRTALSRNGVRRKCPRHRITPSHEGLEARAMLDAGIVLDATVNTLIITGTQSTDSAIVSIETRGTETPYDDMVRASLLYKQPGVGDRAIVHSEALWSLAWLPPRRPSDPPVATHITRVRKVVFLGLEGNDTFQSNSALDCTARGGPGNDWLIGGRGYDRLEGDLGNDTLQGGVGNDVLDGGEGDDTLDGGEGNDLLDGRGGRDTARGGSGPDTLRGGAGNDRLYGDSGADRLYGDQGDDVLLGGDGPDQINGGTGEDGLIGGTGTDTLTGGRDADRFLLHRDTLQVSPGIGSGMVNRDRITDLATGDARIHIVNGPRKTMSLFGTTVAYSPGAWTAEEIEQLDSALEILHHGGTGTSLLKTAERRELTFSQINPPSDPQQAELSQGLLGWNVRGTGTMFLVSHAFSNSNALVQLVFHEVGHNWDDGNPRWDDFLGLSGWRGTDPRDDRNFLRSGDDQWWYRNWAEFASVYARRNPFEDFAESFASYFMLLADREFHNGGGASSIPNKIHFLATTL